MTYLALIAPVQFIVDVLKPILVWIHDTLGVGWGMSIVLLTVLVRAAMAPLTVKQFKSMRAMAAAAPKLKELQAKYKDDKQRQQQEIMKFYAENKINPFASCLPLLAQFPFFIGLFYLLQTDLRREICGGAAGKVTDAAGKLLPCGQVQNPTGHEQFLFIPDLTAGATGWVLAVLMILYVGSQLLSTLLTPTNPDRNQQMLMYGLPLVFSIFILLYNFPAGLLVYWITTNLWTVSQGYLIRKKLGPVVPVTAAGGKDEDGPPAGGLFARLQNVAAPKAATQPATTAAGKPTASAPPPRPPRKKKKRSGRRR
jgi:YidC/Oxa1 family membrane protein insertase